MEHGYRPGDIAFLVRTRAEGAAISDLLIANGYNIMTEDSLRLSSSAAVRRTVDCLKEMAAGMSGTAPDGEDGPAAGKSLYNICETLLRSRPEGQEDGGSAFVNAFLDCVLEYIGAEGSDLTGPCA